MTRTFKPKTNSDFTPPKKLGGGVSEGFVSDVWCELARAKCRTDMLRCLTRLDIGVNEVEDYNSALNLKLRSNFLKMKGLDNNRDVVRAAMRGKLRDAVHTVNEITRRRDKTRRDLKTTYGPKTVTTRKIIRSMKQEAEEVTKKMKIDYRTKIDHLKKKHRNEREAEKLKIPENVKEFEAAVVFNKEKYEAIPTEEIEVTVIGEVTLSEDELNVLKLHPAFSIRGEVSLDNLEYEQELG